jgi:hypothetical protein
MYNVGAGVAGERETAHFLKREFGQSDKVAVFNDLRIGIKGDFTQIDHLLIHRVQRAAWVLETKNYAGRLSCDEHGDWTVWRGGKPTSIPSPIEQARRQCEWLRLCLKAHGLEPLNRIEPVVLISPSSSVNRTKLPPDSHVVKSDNFGTWWNKRTDAIGLGTALTMVGRHLLGGMSRDDLVAFGERLVRLHVTAIRDWRAQLRLPPSDVHTEPSSGPPETSQTSSKADEVNAPLIIQTIHGKVTITRVPDGRYALRNEKNDALIELVKNACKGKANWNPRFRNWLITESELTGMLVSIRGASGGRQNLPPN